MALNNLAYLKAEAGHDLDQALVMALQAHEKAPSSLRLRSPIRSDGSI